MPKSREFGSCGTIIDLLKRMSVCHDHPSHECRALPFMPINALSRFSGRVIPDDTMNRMLPAVAIACACQRKSPACEVPRELAILILRNFGVLKNSDLRGGHV